MSFIPKIQPQLLSICLRRLKQLRNYLQVHYMHIYVIYIPNLQVQKNPFIHQDFLRELLILFETIVQTSFKSQSSKLQPIKQIRIVLTVRLADSLPAVCVMLCTYVTPALCSRHHHHLRFININYTLTRIGILIRGMMIFGNEINKLGTILMGD